MSNAQGCQCGQAHAACTTEFQYAVKVLCGTVDADTPDSPVAWGQYWTAINVHNPDKCKNANYRVKLAVANDIIRGQGPISIYIEPLSLGPDAALEIDCPVIRLIAQITYPPPQSPPKFIKGYFVIESDIELDVVAVYTGAQSTKGPISTFQTERVQGRCVPVCEDLVLPLNTGLAAWQTVSPTPGALGPVAPLATNPGWTAPLPVGSQWVSQSSTDSIDATATGTGPPRTYELSFDLCSGFESPAAFPIQVLVDDTAKVYLNGAQVGTGSVQWNTLTTLVVDPAVTPLRVGHNSFRVEVTNKTFPPPPPNNPTGFALAGILRVARGKCPCAPLPLVPPQQGRGADTKEAASLFDQIVAASKAS
jgi:hypothetical protein